MSDIGEQMMRPIIGIEYRTAQEAFDIMCERFRSSAAAIEARDAEIARLREVVRDLVAYEDHDAEESNGLSLWLALISDARAALASGPTKTGEEE